jgi:hypothetical protein
MSNDEVFYTRGAFIAYQPGGDPRKRNRAIPFRFNPETITRNVALQAAPNQGGTEGAQPAPSSSGHQATSPDAGGTLKESFNVTIRIDAADRGTALAGIHDEFGVAPEIAAIEDLLYPSQTAAQQASTGKQPVAAVGPRPMVLFVWGPKRVLPVRIASLKIDETVYDTMLNPVRAEIEVALEVLGAAEAANDKTVKSALAFTDANRRQLAQIFYDRTSGRATSILPKDFAVSQ